MNLSALIPAKAGIQRDASSGGALDEGRLDSRFRGNDDRGCL
jgi:hypothetical protein